MITPKQLVALLEKSYSAKANAEEQRFPIRGSGMGKCPREHSAVLAKRKTLPFTFKAGRTFEDGHDRGESLAMAIDRCRPEGCTGLALEFEVLTTLPVKTDPFAIVERMRRDFPHDAMALVATRDAGLDPRLRVRGRVDVALFFPDRRVVLVDFKGKNDFGMDKLDEEGVGHDYEMQLACYREGLEEKGYTVDNALVLFENKDTQAWKALEVPEDSAKWEACKHEIAGILDAYGQGASFSGDEGTPMYARDAIAAGGGKLPWNCNYCRVGPKVGNCTPGLTLIDKRKPGKPMPAWEAV